eukprot:TRINITY_DN1630_c0_g1_i2.p1 TRINITY_DN1630_c0_g1~~TRINITY_DN1630_c0_g1_i2.p1  ORF type:complete len:889 (+),score=233.92 TRINITY_DN1630_c0_g1_i2:31-2697(+)
MQRLALAFKANGLCLFPSIALSRFWRCGFALPPPPNKFEECISFAQQKQDEHNKRNGSEQYNWLLGPPQQQPPSNATQHSSDTREAIQLLRQFVNSCNSVTQPTYPSVPRSSYDWSDHDRDKSIYQRHPPPRRRFDSNNNNNDYNSNYNSTSNSEYARERRRERDQRSDSSSYRASDIVKPFVIRSMPFFLSNPTITRAHKKEIKFSLALSVEDLAQKGEMTTDSVMSLVRMCGGELSAGNLLVEPLLSEVINRMGFRPVNLGVDLSFSRHTARLSTSTDKQHVVKRSPIICIMGHVDHGKTTLLDSLRGTRVAASEAGGITQRIGAFSVPLPESLSASFSNICTSFTFLDTPGHAAFQNMRRRGVSSTDLVVLVVAADDGVMPQTLEAIKLAREANVPMLVAINKIDVANADPKKVLSQLAENGVVCDTLGGDVMHVEISAKQKTNMDDLLTGLLLLSESLSLESSTQASADAFVIEAQKDMHGTALNVIVYRGQLRVGDVFVCGYHSGKIRKMVDESGQSVQLSNPGTPVRLYGIDVQDMTKLGVTVQVVNDEKQARSIISLREAKGDLEEAIDREETAASTPAEEKVAGPRKAKNLAFQRWREILAARRMYDLPAVAKSTVIHTQTEKYVDTKASRTISLMIKADTSNRLEALLAYCQALPTQVEGESVYVTPLRYGVGAVTADDVSYMGSVDRNAVVLAFGVSVEEEAAAKASHLRISIRSRQIIFDLMDDIMSLVSAKVPPRLVYNIVGSAVVQKVFPVDMKKQKTLVAGLRVATGRLEKSLKFRVRRNQEVVFEGVADSLRYLKEDISVAEKGTECGLVLEGYTGIQEKDVIECCRVTEVPRVMNDSIARESANKGKDQASSSSSSSSSTSTSTSVKIKASL